MQYMNGNDLFQMFNYGTHFVLKKRKLLNDINVFPVPDGDTGNNLVHTMKTISRESIVSDSFYDTLESISDAALIGARGNSGIIFAQFVNGLLKSSVKKAQVTIDEFTQMVEQSVEHVYSALSNPVEGTMLTVIRDWADGLKKILSKVKSIKDYFSQAFEFAVRSLERTKEQLAVLKRNKVVDSGAMGFVIFLKGINSYYNKETIDFKDVEAIEINEEHHFDTDTFTFRYCTEGLVEYTDKKVDEKDVEKALEPYGDSLIVVMGNRMFRIHIHTDQPAEVFDELLQFGHIISQKVDDMIQDKAFIDSEHDTVIVTDSIADLDKEFIQDHHIAMIPINLTVDGISYKDKVTINNDLLFNIIDTGIEYPTSSAPSIKAVNDLFTKLLLHYKHVIVILVAEKLSATYQVVKSQADELIKKGRDIRVIDSYNNSASEGLLVRRAALMVQEGKTADQIEKKIKKLRLKTEVLVCLESFKYATMSGRLPKVVGKIGMLFGIRPIMTLGDKGKGSAFGFALSQKGITKKIVKYVKKDLEKNKIEEYSLIHCLNPELLKEYRDIFTELIGKPPVYEAEVSSVTSIHSGKGSVAIGYIRK